MPEDSEDRHDKVRRLEKENLSLKNACESLREAQETYEELIGEHNAMIMRADMARMELEQIFSAYSDATLVVREDGVVLRANAAMLQLFGKTEADVIGERCASLLGGDLCKTITQLLRSVRGKKSRDNDVQLPALEQNDRHYLLTTAPLITIDGTPGIVAQFKDITSRKGAEAALARANDALVRMARLDGLTEIANRRCFDETMENEWQRLRRAREPLGLLLGDIDFFKKFNDHYGHQAGDRCLQAVAKTLVSTIRRPADLVARYGGEEFVLLLPEVDTEGALEVGRRALDAVDRLEIRHRMSEVSDFVTISMGAASLVPDEKGGPGDLIALADKALYQAKARGRHCVVPPEFRG